MTRETIVPKTEPETIKPSTKINLKPEFWETNSKGWMIIRRQIENQSPRRTSDPALTSLTRIRNKWQSSLNSSLPMRAELEYPWVMDTQWICRKQQNKN